MNLGDMGADVVKVEEPTRGDETRQWSPYWDGQSCFYLSVNRNKRNIAVNLKHPEGAAVVKKLAAKADVMIESFRTGTTEKMGLGYDDIRAMNPRVIYCSISGFGRTGPLRQKGGYDLMVQAYSGLMSTTGEPDRTPLRIGFSLTLIGTILGEMFAAQHGLGYLLMNAIGLYNVDVIMAVTFLLVVFAASVNAALLAIDRRLHFRA